MRGLVALARWELIILFTGFAAIILAKLLAGGIRMAGLLQGTAGFSPGRAQLLVFTVFVAMDYLIRVIHSPSATALPSISPAIVGVLGGSQAVYLGGKAWSLLRRNQQ